MQRPRPSQGLEVGVSLDLQSGLAERVILHGAGGAVMLSGASLVAQMML